MSVVLHLHVHLAHVVRALRDGLDGEFLQRHRALDDALEGLDGGVHGTVARGGGLKLLAGDIQTDGSHAAHALAGGHLQVVKLHAVGGAAFGAGQHHDVVVGDFLLLVGQVEEILVNLVQLLVVDVHAVHAQTVLQGGTSAAGCQHDAVVVDAHVLGVDNLVGLRILQHAVLMDAAAVGKGIASHDGLVGLHGHVHQARYHAARGEYLGGVDVRGDAQVGVSLEYHGHLLQRWCCRRARRCR